MPSVLFWNVARAGDGAAADEVRQSLEVLAARASPDAIVLCEMLKLTSRRVADGFKPGLAPSGFVYMKPLRAQTAGQSVYGKESSLRFYMFGKNPTGKPWLFSTNGFTKANNSRPVVVLTVATRTLILMHAPSVSQTSTPQGQQMIGAYDAAWYLLNAGKIASMPVAIFGDLNVDLQNGARVQSLVQTLQGSKLATWKDARSGRATHLNRNTGHGSELDWALHDPGFSCKVQAVDVAPRQQVSFDMMDDDDDFELGDEGVDKHSDHLPVLLSW